jgi:hypothetical protein
MIINPTSKRTIFLTRCYYSLKPLIPRSVQLMMRRRIALWKKARFGHSWPIDQTAGQAPEGWSGWPEGKRFALVLTHDVDTRRGHERCIELMNMEKELGFRSSFNFVPERYTVSAKLRYQLRDNGFEVGVHGLLHDGKLYFSKKTFQERAIRINHYLKSWGAVGFRSPSMHHKLDWIHHLNIDYDTSTFDTDPFEPQSDGVTTIFPFLVFWDSADGTTPPPASFLASQLPSFFVELPYTLPQDSTLFVLLKEKNIDIWKQKLDWIFEKGGMVLVNVHPDYMNFAEVKLGLEEYPARYYEEFLQYIKSKYNGSCWHVLPRDMSRFWLTDIEGINERN